MNEVKQIVRRHVLSAYLPGESPDNLRDDTPLQTSGILDSLATQTLISFLEQQFGIELDVYDTTIERFDRIEDIVTTVMRKQAVTAR